MRFKRAYELTIEPNFGQSPINIFDDNAQEDALYLDLENDIQELLISHPIIENKTIRNGLGIKFSVERGIGNTNNKADIEIFNLNQTTRRFLLQDLYNLPKVRRLLSLSAGYLGQDSQKKIFANIFTGYMIEGGSGRQGTEIVTKLKCQEGGYFNNSAASYVNTSLGQGVSLRDIVGTLLSAVGLNPSNLVASAETRAMLANPQPPVALIGNGFTLLRERFGQSFFVDNNIPHILQANEVIEGLVPILTSSTGLIGTPLRRETNIEVKTIFEPRMILGQLVEIKSNITPEFNGQFKVVGIKHEGTISPSQNEDLVTTLQLYIGTQALGAFKLIT